jgi:excisionase family DNA binding protein
MTSKTQVEPGYLTIKELSIYSRMGPTMLLRLVRSGEIPSTRVGRKYFVKITDYDYWARRQQRRREAFDPIVREIADSITGAAWASR